MGAEVRIKRAVRAERGPERCSWCGAPNADTLDHFIPLSEGGATVPGNLVPACKSCNSRRQGSAFRVTLAGLSPFQLPMLSPLATP